MAHERLGQLYEETRRPQDAAVACRWFIAALEDADPELRDRVEEARTRLQALEGSGTESDDKALRPPPTQPARAEVEGVSVAVSVEFWKLP